MLGARRRFAIPVLVLLDTRVATLDSGLHAFAGNEVRVIPGYVLKEWCKRISISEAAAQPLDGSVGSRSLCHCMRLRLRCVRAASAYARLPFSCTRVHV